MTQPEPPVGVPVCYRHPARESHIRCQRCERPICPDCMRDAAVGFQCPNCVAEGRRAMRVGMGPYGGKRSDNPALTSLVLIVLNAAVWLAILFTGGGTSDLLGELALRPVSVADGELWQMITSAFTHFHVWHIGLNMLILWFIGPELERVLGRTRFLALYLISALTASVFVYWLSPIIVLTLGASGAIFGMLGAMLVIAWKIGGDVRPLLIWLGLNAFITFTVPNVSWQGHLGGFVGGVVIAAILVFAPRSRRALVQWSSLAALVVILLAATAARTLTLL